MNREISQRLWVSVLKQGELGDADLLSRFALRRDEAAFEVLVRRHGPMVLGVCRRVLRHQQDAEDAYQATFLVLARRAGQVGRPERLAGWLYGVAYRTALEARSRARRRSREQQVATMPEREAPDPPDEGFDRKAILDEELSRLPEKYRLAVVLCDLEGRTREEAAGQLGVPVGTLSGRLTTAHRKLAVRLTRRGVTLAPAGVGGPSSRPGPPAPSPLPWWRRQSAVARWPPREGWRRAAPPRPSLCWSRWCCTPCGWRNGSPSACCSCSPRRSRFPASAWPVPG